MTTTEQTTMAMVERATKRFADERNDLAHLVGLLNDGLEKVKERLMPEIRASLAVAMIREKELRELIEVCPELFDKPKTQVFHGIKVGFRKGTGGVDWDDDEQVVKLIRKHFEKDQADLLIKTTEKPIAKAIQDLDVADLKRIGCRVEATGDVVLVKPVDGEVEKTVNALLKDAAKEAQ